MDRPQIKDSLDMHLEGVFSSEVVDSSGEIVKIDGMDISTFEAGEGTANVEHVGVHDGLGKETVGKVIYVKKIFSRGDCEDESQRFFFDLVKGKPFLYGIVRLFDGSGHAEAQRLAAQIRDYNAHKELILVRFSIEGSTLSKKGNVVEESFAKKVALTITPANKVCNTRLLTDPNAPSGFEKMVKSILEDPTLHKIGVSPDLLYNPILGVGKDISLGGLFKTAIRDLILAKALTAGNMDVAPSARTGGAALQGSSISKKYAGTVLATARDYRDDWDRDKFKKKLKESFTKAELPDVSDEYLEHFTSMAEDWKVKKSTPESSSLSRLLKSESALIELRKATRMEIGDSKVSLPDVFIIYMNTPKGQAHVGRFMVFNNKIYHLEDYHGIIETLLPDGPINDLTADMIGSLTLSPYFSLQEHKITPEPEKPVADVVKLQVQKQPDPPRPSVFEYHRPGMVKPHVVEFSPNGAAIDGKALEDEDLQLLLENARKGLATIKWTTNFPGLNKSEPSEEMGIHEAMQFMRDAEKAGHLPPGTGQAFTKHIFTDLLATKVGNKFASMEFLKQDRPGVYASIDANDFKHVNDVHGHIIGDKVIGDVGNTFGNSARANGNVKVFRPSGDELIAYAPTHEDMSHFLRHSRSSIDALPLVGGQHKLSFSVGLGATYAIADDALKMAKAQKVDPVTKQRLYPPGKTPHLGHSLYPGHEGPMFMDEGVKQHLPDQPKSPSPTNPVTPTTGLTSGKVGEKV